MLFLVFVLLAIASFAYWVHRYEKDTIVKVPTGSVAWDGETVYGAGKHSFPYEYQLIDIEPRITTFGVDVLGLVSVIDTSSEETGHVSEDGYNEKGSFGKSIVSGKSGNQTVTTRQTAEFKHRYIIVWKPDVTRIRQYLKSGNIPNRLAELLRTLPDLDLSDYVETLGIEIVSIKKPEKKKDPGSVELADGAEIPY